MFSATQKKPERHRYATTFVKPSARVQNSTLQQVKIIQLLAILKNIPPNLAPINPRNEIFHSPCNQIRRIGHSLRPDPDMSLLNNFGRSLNSLGHP